MKVHMRLGLLVRHLKPDNCAILDASVSISSVYIKAFGLKPRAWSSLIEIMQWMLSCLMHSHLNLLSLVLKSSMISWKMIYVSLNRLCDIVLLHIPCVHPAHYCQMILWTHISFRAGYHSYPTIWNTVWLWVAQTLQLFVPLVDALGLFRGCLLVTTFALVRLFSIEFNWCIITF